MKYIVYTLAVIMDIVGGVGLVHLIHEDIKTYRELKEKDLI